MTAYQTESMAWAFVGGLVGLVAGFVLGRAERTIRRISRRGKDAMTTPEKVRRRERLLIVMLVVIGVLFTYFSVQDSRRDDAAEARDDRQYVAFKDCITDQFTALTDALTVRGDLAEAESSINRKVILTVAAQTRAGDFPKIAAALVEYEADQRQIAARRKVTKIPPFPNGQCEEVPADGR